MSVCRSTKCPEWPLCCPTQHCFLACSHQAGRPLMLESSKGWRPFDCKRKEKPPSSSFLMARGQARQRFWNTVPFWRPCRAFHFQPGARPATDSNANPAQSASQRSRPCTSLSTCLNERALQTSPHQKVTMPCSPYSMRSSRFRARFRHKQDENRLAKSTEANGNLRGSQCRGGFSIGWFKNTAS